MQAAGRQQASHQANNVERLGSLLSPGRVDQNQTQKTSKKTAWIYNLPGNPRAVQ